MKNDQSFFQQVYDVVKQIPKGRVASYGHIAEFLGSKGAARMVGWAMNASHSYDPSIPAHRVVNRKGMLTGKHHFQTDDMMQKLLEAEGHQVMDNQIIDFENKLWVPAKELS
jgi:methylated-DNA-protein-cysteine methyltransferase-like protein